MSKKNKNAIESHLENLMAHILKWKNQIQKRSKSWENTIRRTRDDIKGIQQEQPSLNDTYIEKIWEETLEKAKKTAEKEMQASVKDDKLTWDEVFETPYILALIFIAFLMIISLVRDI